MRQDFLQLLLKVVWIKGDLLAIDVDDDGLLGIDTLNYLKQSGIKGKLDRVGFIDRVI